MHCRSAAQSWAAPSAYLQIIVLGIWVSEEHVLLPSEPEFRRQASLRNRNPNVGYVIRSLAKQINRLCQSRTEFVQHCWLN